MKNKLPSKYQVGDKVSLQGHVFEIEYVKFTKDKVYYGFPTVEVPSEEVEDAA